MNAAYFVPWVYDNGLAGCLIAKKGAIALQRPDRKGFEDHKAILERVGAADGRSNRKGRPHGSA